MQSFPVAAFLLLSATAASAQTAPAPQPESAPPKPKPICRQAEARTGSLMPSRRICKTREEWIAIDRQADAERHAYVPDPGMARSTSPAY